jgi:hypothetical protein
VILKIRVNACSYALLDWTGDKLSELIQDQTHFHTSQVQNMNVGTPSLQRNPSTGEFTLTIRVDKSTNLSTRTPMPMTAPRVLVNGQGRDVPTY